MVEISDQLLFDDEIIACFGAATHVGNDLRTWHLVMSSKAEIDNIVCRCIVVCRVQRKVVPDRLSDLK